MGVLIIFFSKTGTTARAASHMAGLLGADTYEIKEAEPYTSADLNWNDPASRANREQEDPDARPAYQGQLPDVSAYDMVIFGHPVWWGIPPRILWTVIEDLDLSGLILTSFGTSGGSTYSGSQAAMSQLLGPEAKKGQILADPAGVKRWLEMMACCDKGEADSGPDFFKTKGAD